MPGTVSAGLHASVEHSEPGPFKFTSDKGRYVVRLAVEHRANVEQRMSAAEIAEAQRLSSSWRLGQDLVR